ncbi:MAG: flagellar hook-basal body complex protein FliE [Sandaracinaceae bacterium]
MTIPVGGDYSSFASTLARAEPTRGVTPSPIERTEVAPGRGFADRVRELVDTTNAQQVEAQQAAEQYANGERNDLHGTMIALEQADITFRLVSNVRSRLVEAYREVMRMGT